MDFREIVDDLTAVFVDAFNRGDAAIAAGLYALDAIYVNPGPVTVTGRAAIQAAFAEEHASGARILGFQTTLAEANGSIGWAVQDFPTSLGPTVVHLALRFEGETWRIAAETVVA